jgi:shikimate dehydrogenase
MTDKYAVIGNPVAHSKSPQIHAAFARQTGQDLEYGALLAPAGGFAATVAAFRAGGGRGLNVTMPFKIEACEFSAARSERAQAAGAVNTLVFESGRVFGDNTDGAGLVRDIANNHGFAIAGKKILLLGAGGAAAGVLQPLLAAGPAHLAIANRTPARAQALAARFSGAEARSFNSLSGGRFDLVINATAASVAGERPALPRGVFAVDSLAYDLMYGKSETPFLAMARGDGAARLADGLGMLVEQAAESFFIWRGVRPDTAPVLAALRA